MGSGKEEAGLRGSEWSPVKRQQGRAAADDISDGQRCEACDKQT